jgi:adenylosuccinate lyase
MNSRQANPEESLYNVSIFDGRQSGLTEPLRDYFSEAALYKYRVRVEIEWLKFLLTKTDFATHVKNLTTEKIEVLENDIRKLDEIKAEFSPIDAYTYERVGKNGKKPTDHDVKAMELAIADIMVAKDLRHMVKFVHFGLTSEDVSNIAYNLMLREAIRNVWMPSAIQLAQQLIQFTKQHADTPVLGRTHGLPASPTTVGKQYAVILCDMMRHIKSIHLARLSSKFAGPVGNHNAFKLLMPDLDIRHYSRKFVNGFDLDYVEAANQTTLHSSVIELFNHIEQLNLTLLNLANQIRDSILLDRLIIKNNRVGSSVMAHKPPNPWRLEAVEALVIRYVNQFTAAKLTLKNQMLENSIGYHSAERAYGELVALSLICIRNLSEQLTNISIDKKNCSDELEKHHEIFSEALNMAMRLHGCEDAYFDVMRKMQGRNMAREQYLEAVLQLNLSSETEKILFATLADFTGDASSVALNVAEKAERVIDEILRQ